MRGVRAEASSCRRWMILSGNNTTKKNEAAMTGQVSCVTRPVCQEKKKTTGVDNSASALCFFPRNATWKRWMITRGLCVYPHSLAEVFLSRGGIHRLGARKSTERIEIEIPHTARRSLNTWICSGEMALQSPPDVGIEKGRGEWGSAFSRRVIETQNGTWNMICMIGDYWWGDLIVTFRNLWRFVSSNGE